MFTVMQIMYINLNLTTVHGFYSQVVA